jgi:hypothetical protein
MLLAIRTALALPSAAAAAATKVCCWWSGAMQL